MDYYGEDFGGHSSFPIGFLCSSLFYLSLISSLELTLSPMETNFCVQRLEKSFQTILLHVVMFKTILLVLIGIITGLKIF